MRWNTFDQISIYLKYYCKPNQLQKIKKSRKLALILKRAMLYVTISIDKQLDLNKKKKHFPLILLAQNLKKKIIDNSLLCRNQYLRLIKIIDNIYNNQILKIVELHSALIIKLIVISIKVYQVREHIYRLDDLTTTKNTEMVNN
ncbi:hypothetical protein BpHYR1_015937 [Brachionus plicatilis]|uniref:Uncharacterized protein n=1 Tax=Brachionus plicatilis TaxID=10195 RepID=A0A3M7S5V9_BRAPC|nr:hypothetical protein BpHYR1_015937 [Brachionus plicatilis]